jgi:hypothetical protein
MNYPHTNHGQLNYYTNIIIYTCEVRIVCRSPNCGARPLVGRALLVLGGGGRVVCMRDIFILNDVGAQDKILYILFW